VLLWVFPDPSMKEDLVPIAPLKPRWGLQTGCADRTAGNKLVDRSYTLVSIATSMRRFSSRKSFLVRPRR
jgi:hypothetical protein